MFDGIAPRYDLLNRVLSAGIDRRWRRACVDELKLQVPSRILDLCSGTADLALEFLRRDPEHTLAGVDLSLEMLKRGAQKLAARSMSERGWLSAGDAERLPFPDGSFDGAMVAFGIRNVASAENALREVYRVLRPGSRLVILEFSMPRGPVGALYRLYFGHILPKIGGIVSGNPGAYRYLPDSVARFKSPRELGDLMEGVGFVRVRWQPLTAGIAYLHRGVRE
jgi:demethylmenaquinone methyltransferase/2-methoxy-6-polyprenyl-1,4-benzoquinol methylase